jgi:hypothetical protein
MKVRRYRSKGLVYLFIVAGTLAFLSKNAGTQTPVPNRPDWPQWGFDPRHSLFDASVIGQPLNQNIVNLVYDFNVDAEKADPNAAGDLLVHYQVPLVDGNDVFIESKNGTYSNSTYSTQRWHQNKIQLARRRTGKGMDV